MKKNVIFATTLLLMQLVGCKPEDLAKADFSRSEVKELNVLVGDAEVMLEWSTIDNAPTPQGFVASWVSGKTEFPGGTTEVSGSAKSVKISGLENDITYTFSIQAQYAGGLSGKVSKKAAPKSFRYPVTDLLAAAGDTKARLTWTAPLSDKLEGYEIIVTPGNQVLSVDKMAITYEITGLNNNIEYTFSVISIYPTGKSEAITSKATPGIVVPILVNSLDILVNQNCTFVCNDMYFVKGTIKSVVWSFGDGQTSTLFEPILTYLTTGVYIVTATVTYDDNTQETGTIEMTVTQSSWEACALQFNGLNSGYVKCSNPVFSPDGKTMYVPTSNVNGDLYAIDVATGTVKWFFQITKPTYGGGALVGADGTIYQCDQASNVFAINPDGTQKWVFVVNGSNTEINAFPALYGDVLYVLANGTTCSLYAINVKTGLKVWDNPIAIEGAKAGALTVTKQGLIVAGTNSKVVGMNASGAQQWEQSLSITERGSFAIGPNGTLYAALRINGATPAGLAAINPANGALLWTFNSGNADGDSYYPIVDLSGVIYYTSKAKFMVYAVMPDGTEKWSKNVGLSLTYTGLALADNGKIYGATQSASDGNFLVFGLKTTDGSMDYQVNIADQVMGAVTIGPDKRLYFGTINTTLKYGSVRALDIQAGLQTGSWSVRGGNVQGTNIE